MLVFFSPFSMAITLLDEERANLSAFRTFVRFVLVWICRFPLPLGVWEGLRFVIVALPRLFSYLFFYVCIYIAWDKSGYHDVFRQYFFLFLLESICCGYSWEASQWGTSNEYLQCMFLWRNQENVSTFWLKCFLSGALYLMCICLGKPHTHTWTHTRFIDYPETKYLRLLISALLSVVHTVIKH